MEKENRFWYMRDEHKNEASCKSDTYTYSLQKQNVYYFSR